MAFIRGVTHGNQFLPAETPSGVARCVTTPFPLAELFPPGISFQIETKECFTCKETLPVRRFYFNRTNGKYLSSCKSCSYRQSVNRRLEQPNYFREWHKKHPGMQNLYAKRSHEKAKALGKKRKHSKPTPASKKRHSIRSRANKITKRSAIYRNLYGGAFADTYVEIMTRKAIPKSGQNVIKYLKLIMLPSELTGESWSLCHRVEQLNVLSGQPFGFLGPWKCSCGVSSRLPRFFDIDHIIPSAKGGSNGYHNLQILCPNCHRDKTIRDYPRSGFNECVPAAHTPGVISTTASNGADVLTNQAPYMGFPPGVTDAQTVNSPSVILTGPTGRGGSSEPE